MMEFEIGYTEETADGWKWVVLKTIRRATDTEAEAEIDSLKKSTPSDIDGDARKGLYIKRGKAKWFRQFSCHA